MIGLHDLMTDFPNLPVKKQLDKITTLHFLLLDHDWSPAQRKQAVGWFNEMARIYNFRRGEHVIKYKEDQL